MIDDRRQAILRAVVQRYIETSLPVGSGHVAGVPGIETSSATVRSEMAALERDGYLKQPHTSAGRIPTDSGYRLFVDSLDMPGQLDNAHQQNIGEFFAKASGEIEEMLHESGRLLSEITGAAAVVVGPNHDETAHVRSTQIVSLNEHTSLVVVVFSDGTVEKRTMELSETVDEDVIHSASRHLSAALEDKVLSEVESVESCGNAAVDSLVATALDFVRAAPRKESDKNIYVGGGSRLAGSFEAVETVRNVLSILEQQYVVVTLIRELLTRDIAVSIGAEHNLASLEHCSIVIAPTTVHGERAGSVAVLGPTRMDYSQAIAAVAVISKRLGERLGGE